MIKALVTFGLVASTNTAMALGVSATLHDLAKVVNRGATKINSLNVGEQGVDSRRVNSYRITAHRHSQTRNGEWKFRKTNVYVGKPIVSLDEADRLLPEALKLSEIEKVQMTSIGAVACTDYSVGSGFVIDSASIFGWKESKPIIATAAHTLYNPKTGESRGKCYFYAANNLDHGVLIEASVVGGTKLKDADSGDWGFARLSENIPGAGSIMIEFEDKYDFDLPDKANAHFLSGLYVFKSSSSNIDDKVALSVDCKPETKKGFLPPENENDDDYRKMIIHPCGLIESGSGGFLAERTPAGLRALGINVGDVGDGTDGKSEVNAVFNGAVNFNYARRFDNELEEKLKEFVGASSD